MKATTKKLSDGETYISFPCRCAHTHMIPVTGPQAWGWNGSLEFPTLSPSILCTYGEATGKPGFPRCHLFVQDGTLRYCGDSQHEFAGQTVPMQDIQPAPAPHFP